MSERDLGRMFPTLEISTSRFEADGIRHVTVFSTALGRRVDCSVWIPEGAGGPLPLVTLLHGVYGSHWAWFGSGGAHHTAAELIRAGDIPPVVLACPSDGLFGFGTGYVPHRHADHEGWVTDEVPAAAAAAAPVDADAVGAIIGLSMGGYGALRLAALHPGRYAAAVGLSAITRWSSLQGFVDLPGHATFSKLPVPDRPDLDALLAATPDRPPMLLTCGSDDALAPENRDLHQALSLSGHPITYREPPGDHDWPFWIAQLGDALRFATRHL